MPFLPRFLRTAAMLTIAALASSCAGGDDDDAGAPADDDGANDADDDEDNGDDNDNNDADDDDDDDDDDDNDDSSPGPLDAIYVAKAGDDANSGAPDAPKLTIAAGLAAAVVDALPVFVAEGVYEESVVVTGKLRGGYRYPDWARDIAAFPTRIESDRPSVVVVSGAVADVALVEGFTIGHRFVPASDFAAAVLVTDGPARLTQNTIEAAGVAPWIADMAFGVAVTAPAEVRIEDNVIVGPGGISQNGVAVVAGVAVREDATRVVLRANRISAGTAAASLEAISAGVYVDAGYVDLLFAHNWATGGSALAGAAAFSDGVDLAGGHAALIGNVLAGGDARSGGMAISTGLHTGPGARSPLLINNTLLGAGAGYATAAAEFETGAKLVNNVLVVAGAGTWNAAMIVSVYAARLYLHHNDFWCLGAECALVGQPAGGSGGFRLRSIDDVNRCQWGSCFEAVGNVAVDPLLVGLDDAHLRPDSPCIDVGIDPSPWWDGADARLDIDGEARPLGWSWDLGADELK